MRTKMMKVMGVVSLLAILLAGLLTVVVCVHTATLALDGRSDGYAITSVVVCVAGTMVSYHWWRTAVKGSGN